MSSFCLCKARENTANLLLSSASYDELSHERRRLTRMLFTCYTCFSMVQQKCTAHTRICYCICNSIMDLSLIITYLTAGGAVCNCKLDSGVAFALCSGVRLDKLERLERTSETGATPRELNIWSSSFR
jgi:hypothetical protein